MTYKCDYDAEFDYLYIQIEGLPSTGENVFGTVILFKKLTGIDINGFKKHLDELNEKIEELSEGYITADLFRDIKIEILVNSISKNS